MADRYIIEGATYNGDGTASNEAASAGAAGAWNHINILTGTAVGYGSLAAGDTVYIRSKTSAGADITVTLTAAINLGLSSATATAWVTWVLDGGDTWAGVQGVLTYTSAAMWATTFRDYNEFIAYAEDKLVISTTNANPNANLVTFTESRVTNLLIDISTSTAAAGSSITLANGTGKTSILTNLHYKIYKWYNYAIYINNYGFGHLINPNIELLSGWTTTPFNINLASRLEIDGGFLHGNTTGLSALLAIHFGAFHQFNHFHYPKTIPLLNTAGTSYKLPFYAMSPDGLAGAVHGDSWGWSDSRNDGYYPYLNATLPDSVSTGVSWKIYPRTASLLVPFVARISKLFTDTAAAKVVTVEMQIADHFSTLDRSTLWAVVTYVDATTGEPRSVSSKLRTTTVLTTSTAPWSAATWGAIGLTNRKIEITTPTTIKQDTMVQVMLMGTAAAPDANGVIFLDPDVTLSTP